MLVNVISLSKNVDDKYSSELEKEKEMELEEEALDYFAQRFFELSTREFESESELDNAVNEILNDMEQEYFFKELMKEMKRIGKGISAIAKKRLRSYKGFTVMQAVKSITQPARNNLKGTLGTLAKAPLKGALAAPSVGADLDSALSALGFGSEEGVEQNKKAWRNFSAICREAYDYLARNLTESADDPVEANRLASEAYRAAFRKTSKRARKNIGKAK